MVFEVMRMINTQIRRQDLADRFASCEISFKRMYWKSLPPPGKNYTLFRVGKPQNPYTYIHYPKIVYALLNKTVSLMSYYSLPANSITPNLLMKIALIRGNCLSLSVSCYIGVLHHSIHPALPWRILRINSLAFLLTSLLLFDLNWNQTLSRIFIYLMKSL